MRKLTFLLTCLFLIGVGLVNAQSKSVSGKVLSAEDGQPVIGASVMVKGTSAGTVTGVDGDFNITLPGNAKTLVISYVGMKSIEVEAKSGMTVKLESDAQVLDEVIAVAYGTAKKSSFTGAASVVSATKLSERSLTNVTNALEGTMPGVIVNSGSGQPGAGLAVRIRGFGSVNASNAPLYIVDGVPYDGAISSINTDDIESLTVLKDAASTSLYGSRAANGIVLITTKKGKNEKTKVNFKATVGLVNRGLSEQETVGHKDFMLLSWETMRNGYMFPATGTGDAIDVAGQKASDNLIAQQLYMNPYNVDAKTIIDKDGVFNPNAQLLWADDLNWFDAIQRQGLRQEYSTSISGGTDRSTFYTSFGYLNEKGYIVNSDFERFSARTNVETKVTSYLKTGVNLSASRSNSKIANTETSSSIVNPFQFARNIGPIYPIHRHDPTTGEYLLENGQKQYDYLSTRPSAAYSGRHIVAETEWNTLNYIRTAINARAFAELSLMKGLKFRINGSGDFSDYKESVFENTKVGDGAPAGRGRKVNSDNTTWNVNQILSYDNKFGGEHNLSAKLIHENYSYTYKYLYGFRQGQISSGIYDLINYTTTNELTSYTNTLKRESYLGNLEYNYNDKYYLSGNINYSGSSKFFKDVRWGTFWGVGAAWRIDQESFMKDITAINSMKLRTSYGEIGNDDLLTSSGALDLYPYMGLYNLGPDANNANEAGFWISSLENKSLTWEKNAQFDVALDFELLHRLRGTVEFYNRQSSNLLFKEPQPYSSGVSEIWKNIGTMYNRGLEVMVSVDAVKTKDVLWTIDLTASMNKNKITKMPLGTDGKAKELITGTKKLSEGHSLYDFWLREWYGVRPETGEAMYYAQNTTASSGIVIIGTDTLTTDINNGKYNYVGSSIPDLQGSFSSTLKVKNFDMSFMFTYSLGGKIFDATYQSFMSSGNYGGAKHVDLLKRWQKVGDVTDVPRMDNAKATHFSGTSSRFLIDRSYLMFKNIQVGYTLPKKVSKFIQATDGRIFATAENLFILSNRKGMNVNESFAGVTSNVYSPSRVVSLGLNFNF